MAQSFGIPGLMNASMKWNKAAINGRVVEYRRRLWQGNPIGWYVRDKANRIDKVFCSAVLSSAAVKFFIERYPV